jgi:DNA mismatch repair protein MutS
MKLKESILMLVFISWRFYETFGEDAVRASKILGIVLTKRGAGLKRKRRWLVFRIIP